MRTQFLVSFFYCCLLSLNGQTIEKFNIDSGGASASAGNIEVLYTIGEVAVREVNVGSVSISEGFIAPEFKLRIHPEMFLQGAMLNPTSIGLMNDDLRAASYIPTTSPYADGATCNASVFSVTGNNAIVDWVWVSIRSNDDNQKQIQGRSALLQRDGDVVDVDGISNVIMNIPKNTYYIALEHRNHLGAMSASPIQLNDGSVTIIDFKDSAFNTFGSNAQAVLDSGDMALWAGDTNGDGKVNIIGAPNDTNTLRDTILNDPINQIIQFYGFTVSGYTNEDVNLNGGANIIGANNDANVLRDNILNHPINIILQFYGYNILEQLPAVVSSSRMVFDIEMTEKNKQDN
ncbi:hemagglutinin protein [Winogradskyella sp. 3972H.M.0a.05]|uniref:hemagglutinin protein n=1 Tax=Winogradskyella sp. 3972H.M.0a.05 TaxID=2950277 RepID=UPI00339587AC